MKLEQALPIAERVRELLAPHCERVEIAGSIRRRKPEVGDIEIVAIPKPYEVGLFASGIAPIVEAWPKIRGELPCRYTRRRLPEGIEADLFFARPENWGLIFAIRTGSAAFSARVLAHGWASKGWKSIDGMLHDETGNPRPMREEQDVFWAAGVNWVPPTAREMAS